MRAVRPSTASRTGRLTERELVTNEGRELTYSRLRQSWEKVRGVSGLRMHDLRASCVTNLANACVTLLQAKEWAGNAGLEVHDRYNVVKRQSRAVVGERYGQLLSAELQQSGASEGWQNGECTGLENRRPQGHAGSNPAPSALTVHPLVEYR